MNWLRFFRRDQLDAEQRQELESYLEMTTEEYVARGMEPEAAREAACRKLGNATLIREEIYNMNSVPFLESLSAALRYWLRTIRREPMFAAAVALTLALGIGATTAIFSVVNGILLKPLPYPHAEELVAIFHDAPGVDFGGRIAMSPSMLFTYGQESRVFQHIGGWSPSGATVTGLAEPERTRTLLITFGTLQSLNVPPLLGRWLSQEDDTPGAPEVVLLSWGYWQRRFGGVSDVIGRKITVDSRPRQIVGVMPQSFARFMGQNPDLFIPLRLDRSRLHLGDLSLQGVARLKSGVTLGEANSDVGRMLPTWLRSWPAPNGAGMDLFERARFAPALQPLKDAVVGSVGSVLWLVMSAVGLVLLIACANVANLLLVKAESRQHELSIRIALGAGRGHIVRGVLAESLLLGLVGGLLGLVLAYGGLRLLLLFEPNNLPRLEEVSIDASVTLFALGISLVSCLLCGLVPALKYGSQMVPGLRSGGRSASAGRERQRARNLLVVGQVSLALVLLVTSGLMIRTFQEIRKVQPGFTEPDRVHTFRLGVPRSEKPERVIRIQQEIAEKLATIPGVSAVGMASFVPMDGTTNENPILADNVGKPGQEQLLRTFKFVSPGFLASMGTRLIAGRDLSWNDIHSQRSIVMISENLAKELWGTPSAALGKRVRQPNSKGQWREIVGVVENVHEYGAERQTPKTVYWPNAIDNLHGEVAFAVRGRGVGTDSFMRQIREAVTSVSPTSVLANPRTMQQIYDQSMGQTTFALVMLAIGGSMAMVLSIIGIYGVISFAVAQRRREIGIRMALGARGASVKGMFLRQGLWLTAIGIAIGLPAATALSRLMSSLLFGVTPLDPTTYIATSVVLLLVAVAATYLPARRASAVNPAETLRSE